MNSNIKAMMLAAVMIVAAVAAVSVISDDSSADDQIIITGAPTFDVETHPITGATTNTMTVTFSQVPTGLQTIQVLGRETGETIYTMRVAPEDGSTSVTGTVPSAWDVDTISIVAVVGGVTVEWPSSTPVVDTYTVTVNQPENGTIAVSGEGVVDNQDGTYTVPAETVITIVVDYDATQYQLDEVTADSVAIVPVDGIYTYTVNGDVVIAAQLSAVMPADATFSVAYDAEQVVLSVQNATDNGDGTYTAGEDDVVIITVSAIDGFEITAVNGLEFVQQADGSYLYEGTVQDGAAITVPARPSKSHMR